VKKQPQCAEPSIVRIFQLDTVEMRAENTLDHVLPPAVRINTVNGDDLPLSHSLRVP